MRACLALGQRELQACPSHPGERQRKANVTVCDGGSFRCSAFYNKEAKMENCRNDIYIYRYNIYYIGIFSRQHLGVAMPSFSGMYRLHLHHFVLRFALKGFHASANNPD